MSLLQFLSLSLYVDGYVTSQVILMRRSAKSHSELGTELAIESGTASFIYGAVFIFSLTASLRNTEITHLMKRI